MNPIKYLREVRQETSRVTWPTRRETLISTVMVLVMVAIAAVFFLVVDNSVGALVELILGIGN